MFGWLAKMLMQTPVAGSGCACCEGKREKLEKMRREITGEPEADEKPVVLPKSFRSGSYHAELKSDGSSHAEIRVAAEKPTDAHECCGDGSCGCGRGCCGH